ncbi:MAG: Gfo/Idh/MocA family oxidoreductase, partial [Phycisphaerales bacterium]|nr:Gfo/Idh/MocA family oxidoreductase [Phycisphaerales bacterium]
MRLTRRRMIQSSSLALGGLVMGDLWGCASAPRIAAQPIRRPKNSKLQILQVGVGGTTAPVDREQFVAHPDLALVGLCDVDSDALSTVAAQFPSAFTCVDWREAFAKHTDVFDAVVVCTPDHNHAVIMASAMAANKHVYGQKPLVQQLSEVAVMDAAVRARPDLVTQVGNQRMGPVARQHAVDILRRGLLGKAIEAHVWIEGPPNDGSHYFWYGGLKAPSPPPANLNWPLWLGCAMDAPFREGLAPVRWRSSWDYGTGQLGDWCTHLLDVLVFAYDLGSPFAVLTDTRTPSDFYHAQQVQAVLSYVGGGPHFANPVFPVHYCDKAQFPSRAALGLPPGDFGSIGTLVVCEDGVLCVGADGPLEVWRGGKAIDWKTIPGQGTITERNHWHSWV